MMVREFEDCNVSKMRHALFVFDKIKLSDVTYGLDYRLQKTGFLRSVVLLIIFKHVVDTNNKQEDKQ